MSQKEEAYQEALEEEIKKWAGYERALRLQDRQAFQELMDMARSYAPEACWAENKIVFEPMTMSIILALENCMKQIGEELTPLKPPKELPKEETKPAGKPAETRTAAQPKTVTKKPQRGLMDFG